ncbi:MAG: hypothetical protein JWR80_9851 [Bradyrhizobium sp.]|nr:hypothetical protein [Bradyrhizobium sp.]
MTIIAATELIVELDGAIRDGSSRRRLQMLQQVTHLFLISASRLGERQIDVFGDVLLRLLEGAGPEMLAPLSMVLCGQAAAPREVVRLLACHEAATVAAPILLRSEILSKDDLIEIANQRGQQHLLAISERTSLDEALTDALLRRGDIAVYRALARNVGARFSDQGCLKLAAAAERDGDIADALAVRPALPVKVLHQLLTEATRAAQARPRKTAPLQTCESIRRVVESPSAGVNTKAPAPIDYAEAISSVLALSQAGKLSDRTVNRFAVHGQRTNLVAALSLLAEVAIEVIEPLLRESDCYGLVVACRASRLNWQTTLAVIESRSDARRSTHEELEQAKELFDALSLSIAQRTIRFGSVSELAKPGLTQTPSAAARAI